jgi:hypothetical protein
MNDVSEFAAIFELAARQKLRFPSIVGQLVTEQLWDLPLTTTRADRPSLDSIAREVFSELKNMQEVSFVDSKPDPRRDTLQLQLTIIKHIISIKKAERDAEKVKTVNAAQRQKIMGILADKDDEVLKSKTKEELLAELSKIS